MYKFLNFYLILKTLRPNFKYIILLFFAWDHSIATFAQSDKSKKGNVTPVTTVSGIRILDKDTTSALKSDTTQADSTKKPKRDIETTINYSAEDSIVIDALDRKAFLYKDAKLEYGNMNLTANTIDMDYKINQVNATYAVDSIGKRVGVPIFKEGSSAYEAGIIKYNYKTKRGQVKQIVTKQGEGVIQGKVVKKEPNNTMFVSGATYSTCDLREPHFCIKAMQIKVIPKKKIVTRAFNLQIDDVPTMLAFPFAVFPVPKRRGTGLIFPSYGESQNKGFFLSNLGFYWAMNDYVGVKLLTDQYSIGGFGTGRYSADIDYKSRYSFNGRASVSFSNLKESPDDPINYSNTQMIWVTWSHTPLTKGTGKFAASVNAGSTRYNRINSFNVAQRQTANFSSNVSYSNVIKKTPFSYAISGRQEQNISTGIMNFALPQASLNMNRIYPLKNVAIFNKIETLKKLNFNYTGTFTNNVTNIITRPAPAGYRLDGYSMDLLNQTQTSLSPYGTGLYPNTYSSDSARIAQYYTPDTLSPARFFNGFFDNSRWNATHRTTISTTFKLLKYFNFTPSASYGETWYQSEYAFTPAVINTITGTTFNVDKKRSFIDGGLARKPDVSTGISTTTRIYGTFYIKKFGIEAIRQVLIPTVGFSYKPVFSNYYQEIDTTSSGEKRKTPIYFDRFTGLKMADPSNKKDAANISFSLASTFEAKVVDKSDTSKVKKFKKQMLLDAVNLAGTYNLNADSFNLSNLTLSARTKLLGMFDINFTTIFDPYYYQDMGAISTVSGYHNFKKVKYLAWNHPDGDNQSGYSESQGIGRFVSMQLTVGTRFAGKKGKGKKISPTATGTDYQFMYNPFAPSYVDFSLPWTLNVNYRMSYSRYSAQPGPNTVFNDRSTYSNNLTLNGDVSVSPKWKLGYTSGYDINNAQMTNTVLNVSRDLHCWYATLSTALYPTNFQYFLFTIGIKSGALSDLKIPRRSAPFYNN